MSWTYSDPFAGFEKAIATLAQRVCEETAQDVLKDAQSAAPLDKGALRESGYIATPNDANQGAQGARDAVARANPNAEVDPPFVVEDWSGEGLAQAWIDFLVVYAAFVAYGHMRGGRFVAGRDFLGAAIERNRSAFSLRAQRELDGLSAKK